jgi:hypothetical protein
MLILMDQMWNRYPGLPESQQGQAVTPGSRILLQLKIIFKKLKLFLLDNCPNCLGG